MKDEDDRMTVTRTAEGVKLASVLKTAPLLRSQRISATKPAPTSKTFPEASGASGWHSAATKGATKVGCISVT